jgi:hypothetical protein
MAKEQVGALFVGGGRNGKIEMVDSPPPPKQFVCTGRMVHSGQFEREGYFLAEGLSRPTYFSMDEYEALRGWIGEPRGRQRPERE